MTRVKAAINGGRTRSECPYVPVTAEEIIADARAVIAAGAFAVHAHPRDASGRESLAAEHVAAVGKIGVTTGAWIEPDPDKRYALIKGWKTLPAFASVNMHEPGAQDIAELLLGRGVAVEAGLANIEGAEELMRTGLWKLVIRVLFEPQEQTVDAALANVDAMTAIIARCTAPRLLHGVDATVWPLVQEATRRGWDTRVGFEDTLVLPDGSTARSNAELVRAAISGA